MSGEEDTHNIAGSVHVHFEGHERRRSSHESTRRRSSDGLRRRKNSGGAAQLKDITKVVMKMNRQIGDMETASQGSEGSHRSGLSSIRSGFSGPRGGHRRLHTVTAGNIPFQSDFAASEEQTPLSNTAIPMFQQPSAEPSLLDHAQHLENLFAMGPADTFADLPSNPFYQGMGGIDEGEEEEEEQEQGVWRQSHTSAGGQDVEQGPGDQGPGENTPMLGRPSVARPKARRNCGNWFAGCASIVPPRLLWKAVKHFFWTTFLLFHVPCLAGAWIFYYPLENVDLEFIPSRARLSWFLLFAVRLNCTYQLALGSKFGLQVWICSSLFARGCGPLLALLTMQSVGWPQGNGWPFLSVAWGIWNLILLHGDAPFVKHWLYFTDIGLFSIPQNTGDNILASARWGMILASMIVVGVAASAKRTFVALYLSRRMLQYYRVQMKEIMDEIGLVVDVADLAAQTEIPEFEEMIRENFNQIALDRKKKKELHTVPMAKKDSKDKMGGSNHDDDDDDDDDSDDDDSSDDSTDKELDEALEESAMNVSRMEETVDPKQVWDDLKERAMNDRDTVDLGTEDGRATASGRKKTHRGSSTRSSKSLSRNSTAMIFPFLERWHEPKQKGKKRDSPTLLEIVEFKKAMSFMETPLPFGHAYGSCANRKACVKNSIRTYRKLMKFTPDKPMLSFDVIGALAYEDNGEVDEEYAIAILRLFYPDKDNFVPMLAFAQACDTVYKKMRFLRASISNSTKIDAVLEDAFDAVFYIILALVVFGMCGINLTPFLLSLSSLTVSFAFAFGPSVAKNVEGILMIAVRRPFDIGDRITLAGAESVANTTQYDTWLVEDITLTTTTLRYARTNELATLNNASIASSRIINCFRSSKAMITIKIQFDVDATQRQLDEFRNAMEAYLENRPRKWISLIHYRIEVVDTNLGFVTILYRAQHVKSWQELGAIMIDKGDWEKHANSVAIEMGCAYDMPPRQMTVGLGIAPEDKNNPAIEDRKSALDFLRSISETTRHNADDKVLSALEEYREPGLPQPETKKED